MSTVVQSGKKKKSSRRALPILGLLFALALLAFAYGIASPIDKFAEGQSDTLKGKFNDLRTTFNNYGWYRNSEKYHGGHIIEIIIALVLWFILMALSMFVVAAALIGTDPDKTGIKEMGPSPANRKAMIKQMKKDLRAAKKLAAEQKKKQGKK